MSLIRIYEVIALIVASMLLAAAGMLKAFHMGQAVSDQKWQAKELAAKQAQDASLLAAAQAIAKINVTQQTIVQKVQHEVETKTVYRDCVVPDDGVRLLNNAISGNEAKPSSADGVQPSASSP